MHRFRRIVAAGISAAVAVVLASIDGSSAATSLPDTACNKSAPCLTETNNGAGEAIDGISSKNSGVHGTTHFNSTSSTNFRAGVLGLDLSSLGAFNAGVEGQSALGFGLMGISLTGTGVSGTSQAVGVNGTSTGTGTGVFGLSPVTGVVGQSSGGVVGVLGVASSGSGIGVSGLGSAVGVEGNNTSSAQSVAVKAKGSGGLLFVGENSNSQDVFTVRDSGVTYAASTVYGNGGVEGFCTSACPQQAALFGIVGANQTAAVEGYVDRAAATVFLGYGGGGELMSFVNAEGVGALHIDDSGNIYTIGQIFTHGSCSTGCSPPNQPGKHVTSYVPRESQPTMEDFGEAQLVDGRAYVSLESTFASVTDRRANYLVFITPEGDSRGLYITQKSATGFAVRENQGGRSTLAFSYRLVARPYGDVSPRLPITVMAAQKRRMPVPPREAHDPMPRTKTVLPARAGD